mmetsp:Transcript_14578/g.21974  ORF Transcript_14578/g.21974 Transcript_14578/m.21974 type:complete len:105 (-) Transcript_14578:53-367(-)
MNQVQFHRNTAFALASNKVHMQWLSRTMHSSAELHKPHVVCCPQYEMMFHTLINSVESIGGSHLNVSCKRCVREVKGYLLYIYHTTMDATERDDIKETTGVHLY